MYVRIRADLPQEKCCKENFSAAMNYKQTSSPPPKQQQRSLQPSSCKFIKRANLCVSSKYAKSPKKKKKVPMNLDLPEGFTLSLFFCFYLLSLSVFYVPSLSQCFYHLSLSVFVLSLLCPFMFCFFLALFLSFALCCLCRSLCPSLCSHSLVCADKKQDNDITEFCIVK